MSDLEKASKAMHEKAEGYWYVISSYGNSPARQKTLLQLHSRRFLNEIEAEGWKEFCIDMEKKREKRAYRRKEFVLMYVAKNSDLAKLFCMEP